MVKIFYGYVTYRSGLYKFNRKSEKFIHYEHNPEDLSSINSILPGIVTRIVGELCGLAVEKKKE